ncbi:MAG TPA: ArsA family ATPase [Thermoanaerobaculia bacterium]
MRLTEAFDSIASRRVVMFGGKGGAGKTTISSLAALHYSKTRRVILFTTDPASNLGDLLGDPATQRPSDLTFESLNAQQLYAEFLKHNLDNLLEIGDRGTYLDREELRRFFELSLPGIDELMAWMRIGELAEQNSDALIVVDTAPTGHTLRMLGSAEHFRLFGEALDAMQAKHRGMVQQFMRRNVRDAIDEYITRFEADAQRRRALLNTFVPVFLSEPWVVEQTLRLTAEVREEGIEVPFAVLNRAVIDADCASDRKRQKRDAQARTKIGGTVVDAPRSCVPLDSGDALHSFLSGGQAPSPVRSVAKSGTGEAPVLHLRSAIRMVFLAGKGGVGKTTCAASIALQLAQKNPTKRYTIISVDPAHALRDVFSSEPPPPNLNVEIVVTKEKWQAFRETLRGEIERAVNAITPGNLTVAYDADAMRKLIDIAPPGADELFAISRLADLAADTTQAMVIVDTAPTGHFLRLLELPKTAGDWVREFMRLLLRYRDLVPPGALGEELVSASRAMHSLEETLHSERTAIVVVTRPERIVIAETKRLIESLEQKQIRIAAVIANYMTPQNDCKCDQSMRSFELSELTTLGREPLLIERRDAPVTKLAGLAALFRVASD